MFVPNFLVKPDEDCFRFKNGLSAIIAMLALLAEGDLMIVLCAGFILMDLDALIDEPLFVTELAEHVQFFLDKLLDPPAVSLFFFFFFFFLFLFLLLLLFFLLLFCNNWSRGLYLNAKQPSGL